jgi:pimaricinolide synthase PimS1
LAPKVDGAWHLHELTRDLDLSFFAVFSSLSGVMGAPGQANYAAANAFVDGLMVQRRRAGLTGVSMVWGPWQSSAGMTAALTEADLARMARSGMPALSVEQGLALFDRGLDAGRGVVALTRLDLGAVRALPEVPFLLRGLVGAVRRTAERRESLDFASQVSTASAAERRELVLAEVLANVASVLGYGSHAGIDGAQAFRDLGFDSLTSVELRNRLGVVTGLELSATLVFDYPTPARLSEHLSSRLGPEDDPDEEIKRVLATVSPARLREAGLLTKVLALVPGYAEPAVEVDTIETDVMTADIDDLVRLALDDIDS